MPFDRQISIAYKLAAAMTLLALTVILALATEVRAIERETDAVRRQTELAVSADGPSRLLISIQDEQAWAALDLAGNADAAELMVEGYDETRRRTDDALTGFRELLSHSPDQTRQAFSPAVEGLEAALVSIRQSIDTSTTPHTLDNVPFADDVFDRYLALLDPFFTGTGEVVAAIDRHELRRGAELIDLTNRQVTMQGLFTREAGIAALLSEGGINTREEISDIGALRTRYVHLAEEIRSRSTGPYAAAGDDHLLVDFPASVVGVIEEAVQGQPLDVQEYLTVIAPAPEDTYQAYRERVATILREQADDLSATAARRERIYLVVALLTGALALGVVLMVSRSITRPLRSLAQQVMHTAHHGLRRAVETVLGAPMGADAQVPVIDPITVETEDEVQDLAVVMNTVQHAVVDLAVEQAVLRRNLADSFISLGRRNQNLLSRQLDFITELQHDEVDPEALAHLFQLDHLATRMRRNAESLLVLAGNESPRQWRAPVSIVDIVRAAVGEVEQYQRVRLTVLDSYTVLGNVAVDLAHMLAELIENALLFSPPDEPVEIRGLSQPAGYSLAIIDAGVGMSPSEIAQANRRLAGAEAFTVAPSKYLGHYVAGNLAVRHGIHARLQNSAGPGVTAIVRLPLSLAPASTQPPTEVLVR